MKDNHDYRTQRIAAWVQFLRVHSRVNALLEADLEAAEELSMSWFDVLNQLHLATDNELRMQDLSGRLAMSASGLTRRIGRMEQVGLVKRRQARDDGRGVIVTLTPAGRRRYRRALPVHLRGVERHFLDWATDDEIRALSDLFTRILHAIDSEDG